MNYTSTASIPPPYRDASNKPMSLPFNPTKPEKRPIRVVFWTDAVNSEWLEDMAANHELELSLVCHRIVEQARQSASPPEGERRGGDRRQTA